MNRPSPAGLVTREFRLLLSTGGRGRFVVGRYTTDPDPAAPGLDIAAPDGVAVWTTPPSRDLPAEADGWELVVSFCRGFREQVGKRAGEGMAIPCVWVTLSLLRAHPTDTTPGICEQAGREVADELIELFGKR